MYGLVVDTETTGLNPNTDQVIEIGLILFRYANHQAHIVKCFSTLIKPELPLTDLTKELTGITEQALDNLVMSDADEHIIYDMFEDAEFIVAHNAQFDKDFVEKFLDLPKKKWYCSLEDILWYEKGHKSRKLEHLCADYGFINTNAHRALFDCMATLRLITPFIEEMIENGDAEKFRISAYHAPFAVKDELKARHYKFNPAGKYWYKDVLGNRLAKERKWLEGTAYQGREIPDNFISPLSGSELGS